MRRTALRCTAATECRGRACGAGQLASAREEGGGCNDCTCAAHQPPRGVPCVTAFRVVHRKPATHSLPHHRYRYSTLTLTPTLTRYSMIFCLLLLLGVLTMMVLS